MTGAMVPIAVAEFPSTYTRMLVRELRLDAPGIDALLAGADVSREQVFRLDTRVPLADQMRIIHNAVALSGDPGLGLRVGAHMPHAAHGALGVAIASAPTLRASMEVVERFQRMHVPVVTLSLHVGARDLTIGIDALVPIDGVGLFLVEVLLAAMDGVLEGAVASLDDAGEMRLGYPAPGHAGSYARWLTRPVSFGHGRTSIRLPVGCIDAPNPFADPEMHAQAVLHCERTQADLLAHDTWRARVTRTLREHPGQLWTSDEVASSLHVSVRTLSRHLNAEGCSYQELQDHELYRQARFHLDSPGHTVDSVAWTLGYHDVSAFRRAFKRWAGMTPQSWLAAHGKRRS